MEILSKLAISFLAISFLALSLYSFINWYSYSRYENNVKKLLSIMGDTPFNFEICINEYNNKLPEFDAAMVIFNAHKLNISRKKA
ncbi:MAG: hypothetical protein L3J21_09840 [Devosiaceae bacterium]|nr:hypothetical protein [Devosiaceae bacterium]